MEDGEAAGVGMREIKESVCMNGKVWMVERCKTKAPLVAEVAQRVSWAKVWDASMDLGIGDSDVSSWSRVPILPIVRLPLSVPRLSPAPSVGTSCPSTGLQ